MNCYQMNLMISRPATLALVVCALASQKVEAQLVFKPINSLDKEQAHVRTSAAERDSTQILLPFWDDFSRTTFLPDTTHWFVESGTTTISGSLGIRPPTVNVAAFDGWNNLGVPYSSEQLEIGAGDSLVSRFIDMGSVNPVLFETCFLSFFWQKEGRGEAPDEGDSIRLQVIDAQKNWVTVWKKGGLDVTDTERFFKEIILLDDPEYFHDYFQFRFQTFGRISGGFDTWNIDYVYLNTNRFAGDLFFEDRAMAINPGNWLTNFSAMPYDHFVANLESNLKTSLAVVSNLDDLDQPIKFFSLIQDSSKVFDRMDEGSEFQLISGVFLDIETGAIDPAAFDKLADTISLNLETKCFIVSGDSANWLNKYDLRINDTTSNRIILDRELAYDDGTAEWAAGLSQQGAMLAYRFVIPKPDIITSVNIYFPQFSPTAVGKTFTLIVWDDVFDYREGRLLTEQHIVKQSTLLNEYTSYTLGRDVAVLDTFYVGFEQSVSDFFPVGLDKDGNFHEGNVFINLDGVWEPSNIVDGNLMIRPVFGFEAAVGLEEEIFRGTNVFPNPNRGRFRIDGGFEAVWIIDAMGNVVKELGSAEDGEDVELLQGSGLYLVKILKQGKYKTVKLVIE
jgi:hypothetical protein